MNTNEEEKECQGEWEGRLKVEQKCGEVEREQIRQKAQTFDDV